MTTAIARRILLAMLAPTDFRIVAESVADLATGWASPIVYIFSAADIDRAKEDRGRIRKRHHELKGSMDFYDASFRARLEFLEELKGGLDT